VQKANIEQGARNKEWRIK